MLQLRYLIDLTLRQSVGRSFLTERMWARLEPLLPSEQDRMGRPRLDNRPIIEAILWKHRTGAPWRDLPEFFGLWNTVFTRFTRWNRSGVWQRVLEALRGEADCESIMVDRTVIPAYQHADGAEGGPTSKQWGVHAAVSRLVST